MQFIGIGGGSGSGKTFLCEKIEERLPERTLIFSLDRYYKPFDDMEPEERQEVNFDHPRSLDWQLIIEHLQKLANGKSVEMPIYSYREDTRTGTEKVHPEELILVEGIHALQKEKVNRLLDRKVFLEPDPEIRAARRLKRDIIKRERDPEFATRQFIETTHPMHHEHVRPTRENADRVLEPDEFDDFVEEIVEEVV